MTEKDKLIELPPEPVPPAPGECCERGCDPCVFDYYEKARTRWERLSAQWREQQSANDAGNDEEAV